MQADEQGKEEEIKSKTEKVSDGEKKRRRLKPTSRNLSEKHGGARLLSQSTLSPRFKRKTATQLFLRCIKSALRSITSVKKVHSIVLLEKRENKDKIQKKG